MYLRSLFKLSLLGWIFITVTAAMLLVYVTMPCRECNHINHGLHCEDFGTQPLTMQHLRAPTEKNHSYDSPRKPLDWDPSWNGHGKKLANLFRNKTNGVFVEAGGADGFLHSNTIYLERKLNWTGLLVEANPVMSVKLMQCKRNAWKSDVCLGTKMCPYFVEFTSSQEEPTALSGFGKYVINVMGRSASTFRLVSVLCYPLTDLLLVTKLTHVDVLSLDVQGPELEILKAVDWDVVQIDVIMVEIESKSQDVVKEKRAAMLKFMEERGYRLRFFIGKNDAVFVHMKSSL